jgi:hypothetical protein
MEYRGEREKDEIMKEGGGEEKIKVIEQKKKRRGEVEGDGVLCSVSL